MNVARGQGFAPCFSSFTDYKDDASVFHAQCDPHQRTVVVARNSLRNGAHNTFGGYAALPWNCANGECWLAAPESSPALLLLLTGGTLAPLGQLGMAGGSPARGGRDS